MQINFLSILSSVPSLRESFSGTADITSLLKTSNWAEISRVMQSFWSDQRLNLLLQLRAWWYACYKLHQTVMFLIIVAICDVNPFFLAPNANDDSKVYREGGWPDLWVVDELLWLGHHWTDRFWQSDPTVCLKPCQSFWICCCRWRHVGMHMPAPTTICVNCSPFILCWRASCYQL
jgi:hypothetical protein